MTLIVVDCEATGPCPGLGELTEFGAVTFEAREAVDPADRVRDTFHGVLVESRPRADNPAMAEVVPGGRRYDPVQVFREFGQWIERASVGRPIFVSDNPAYDWQWINHGLWTHLGFNPFGHSARRIGDFYAGLVGDFYARQDWKSLRRTPHTHNPVDDAMGNAEALELLMNGTRPERRRPE